MIVFFHGATAQGKEAVGTVASAWSLVGDHSTAVCQTDDPALTQAALEATGSS